MRGLTDAESTLNVACVVLPLFGGTEVNLHIRSVLVMSINACQTFPPGFFFKD